MDTIPACHAQQTVNLVMMLQVIVKNVIQHTQSIKLIYCNVSAYKVSILILEIIHVLIC